MSTIVHNLIGIVTDSGVHQFRRRQMAAARLIQG